MVANGTYDPVTGIYTDVGSASTLTRDVDALMFTPTAAQVAPGQTVATTFSITITDGPSVLATDTTTTVVATAAHPTPVINGAPANKTVSAGSYITPFAGITIVDSIGQTETLTVALTSLNGMPNGPGVDGTSLEDASGQANWNPQTNIYTIIGSPTAVSNDLRRWLLNPALVIGGISKVATSPIVTKLTISDIDTAGVRAINQTISVTVVPGPAIDVGISNQTINDQASITPFSSVVISDYGYSNDGQTRETETVTVRLSAATGTLTNLGGGSYNGQTGIYSESGTADAITYDLQRWIFDPAAATPGHTVTTSFAINDTNADGLIATASVTSVATRPGPVINGAVAGQPLTDQTTITPFAAVAVKDDPGQTETMTVTLSNAANGDLTNLGRGTYNTATGVYTDAGTAVAVTADLKGLVFTPTEAEVPLYQLVPTTFIITSSDSASLSTINDTTSVDVTSQRPLPAKISGAAASQAATDQTSIKPFANVEISDLLGQTEILTVTPSNPANGTLINLADGTLQASTDIYTVTGTPAEVTADLRGLVFTPTAEQVAPGQAVTTTFAIDAINSAAVSSINDVTSVIATAAPLPARSFTVTNSNTGVTTTTFGKAYTGPVTGITSEFITNSTDNLAITATVADTFIHTGSGNDAIDVSHTNETNVLDGSTGSNFLVGGTGFDTFFLDDRNAAADVFSTVVGFHAGDNATIWGVTSSDFQLSTYDNQGAPGYTGLDFSFTAPGRPNANLVLTGFSSLGLTDGRLTVSYGTTPATGSTSGSNYMLIHAN